MTDLVLLCPKYIQSQDEVGRNRSISAPRGDSQLLIEKTLAVLCQQLCRDTNLNILEHATGRS